MAENTMRVTGHFYDDNIDRTVNVYKDIFKDKKIELLEEPHIKTMPHDSEYGVIEFTIDSNDLDDAHLRVIWTAESQLRALRDYENMPAEPPAANPSQSKKTVVVNMFGGPGAGKSTAALEVAEKLKKAGYVVDYAPEYAKELVWDMNDPKATKAERDAARKMLSGSYETQTKMYAEQLKRVQRCIGQCDFVVTDSPAILGVAYLKEQFPQQREWFESQALHDFNSMINFNMLVKRGADYEQAGRYQSPKEAIAIDASVVDFLERFDIYHGVYDRNQIDKAIENMQKTHRRFVKRQEAVDALKAESKARATTGEKESPEANSKGTASRKGSVIAMAEEKNAREYVNVAFPKTGYEGQDLFRDFTGKDGKPYIRVKFPPHTPEMTNVDGQKFDASNRTFLVSGGDAKAIQSANGTLGVRTGSVVDWDNDPNYKSVSFPKENKDGAPWNIETRIENGHWTNPDAEGKDRGPWVVDEVLTDRVEVTEVKQAMDYWRADKADWAREQQAKDKELAQDKEIDAPFEEAPEVEAPAEKAPAKAKPSKAAPTPKAKKAATPASDAKAAKDAASARSTKKAAPTKAQTK